MNYYLCFCGGLLAGLLIALFYLKKLLKDEFEAQYCKEIDEYRQIISDYSDEVSSLETLIDSLKEENNSLIARLGDFIE